MNYPELFETQPEITDELLDQFEKRGFIVPATSTHKGERRTAEVTNPTAGEVVGYSKLARKLRDREITPDDARALLAVEATREKGPRDTHTARLLTTAFASDRDEVERKIEEWRSRNQK